MEELGQTRKMQASDIFGGDDSDLSDISDDVPSEPERDSRTITRRSSVAESSGEDSGDEYVQQTSEPAKKKRRVRQADTDDVVGEEGGRRRRTQKKQRRRKQPAVTEEDLANLPEEEAKKMRLDMEIDSILKPKKASRPRKRKKNEDVLDQYADEEVSRLREAMLVAADEDTKANKKKLPATAKLRLLPQVMEVLRRGALWQSIVDNNLMEGVRRWLEPLPDRSLPALNVQKEFMDILPSLDVDTGVLKDSRLGRVVLFYTKCKRVTPDIARTANALVSAWTRPIVKRSASYRDRAIPIAVAPAGDTAAPRQERLNAILARAKEGERNRQRPNAVMIPQRSLGTYTVAPRENAGVLKNSASVDLDTERRKRNADRLRSLTRKMAQSKT